MSAKKIEFAVSNQHLAAFAATLILCPFVAEACTWPDGYRLTEAAVIDRFCEADAVFVGEAENTFNVNDQISETKVWPRETLKGQVSSPAYVLNARLKKRPGLYCGFRFQPMGKYLVFADRYEDTDYLCVSTCDLSQKFDADSFVYRVITSTTNVEEECSEEAAKKRQKEHRDEWVRRFSGDDAKLKEMYEITRQLQEVIEVDAPHL